MAIELVTFGVRLFINRWIESKKKITQNITNYLEAAARDKKISNTDSIILKTKILDMIKVTENLNRTINKSKKNIDYISQELIEDAEQYISTLKDITSKLKYEYLNELLKMEGSIKDISVKDLQISTVEEEIAILCIFVADQLLIWIFEDIMGFKFLEDNYETSRIGIKYILTAKNNIAYNRNVKDEIKSYISNYLILYKAIAQYFLCRNNLKNMLGITKEIDTIANYLNFVIRKTENILESSEFLNEKNNHILKIIKEHSIALLCEIQGIKFSLRSLKSYKNLNDLINKIKNNWYYSEWEFLGEKLSLNWGNDNLEENNIDYSVGESVNEFKGTKQEFNNEINEITPYNI
ncbi:hypothetical protein DSAG12_02668 [Promethearchaeum syntrophicum]|uniref:PhoU domain protein n=1 Tax=Promethearchaeum syntrophicum TaxID=2594042 RepID=A0A5B9DC94_9ARCH|nr:hypothetical protein [Candidatus Prometheoarchaeum syntrophicum]QEE16838.1 hypothetical protein DSAG12_02668 [Candidatus Prometheoarchaeum syntrophicum]